MKRNPNSLAMACIFVLSLFFSTLSCSKDSELLAQVLQSPEEAVELENNSDGISPTNTVNEIQGQVNDSSLAIAPDPQKEGFTTTVSISGNQFFINGRPTYEGRYWQGNKIEGLLMNSRMVQGVFDDLNPDTSTLFKYPDTNTWHADRNTNEFVSAMQEWKNNGLLAFTLNLQGGSPTGYENSKPWLNSAFDSKGGLRPDYMDRLHRILTKADELDMVVILGYFYFGQDQVLENETAVINAVDNITQWILDQGFKNLLIEINNECDITAYNHAILRPARVHELINRVKQQQRNGYRLLVSTSYKGGAVPGQNVVQASDFILIHGNDVAQQSQMAKLITDTRNIIGAANKPIINNEDDHYNFGSATSNFQTSVESYVSWGFFDYRRQGEGFAEGYQSVPVDWGVNSTRKRDFFAKLKEITGF